MGGRLDFLGRARQCAPPGGSGYGDSDPRHITNVINAFVRFDANNSGKLDHRELRAALRRWSFGGMDADAPPVRANPNLFSPDV